MADIEQILAGIEQLPHDWHKVGSVTKDFLRAVVRHTAGKKICHSMETGSGKSTLLFSHLSGWSAPDFYTSRYESLGLGNR